MQSKIINEAGTTIADELIFLIKTFVEKNNYTTNYDIKKKVSLAQQIITDIQSLGLKYPDEIFEKLRDYLHPFFSEYGHVLDEFGQVIHVAYKYLDSTIICNYLGTELSNESDEFKILSKKITQDAQSLKKTAKKLDYGRLGKLDFPSIFSEMHKAPDEFGGEEECVFVQKIVRIDNTFLKNKYAHVMQNIPSSLLTNSTNLGVKIQGLPENLDTCKNETYLYHGTSLFTAGSIVKDGFQSEKYNSFNIIRGYGPLGRGTYLTDQLPKAALYSSCTLCKEHRCTCISKHGVLIPKVALLCKVALGNIEFIQNKYMMTSHETQCREGSHARVAINKEINPASEFDSNEYAVMDDNAVYPQYIIFYHHSKNLLKHNLLIEELDKIGMSMNSTSIAMLVSYVFEYERMEKAACNKDRLLYSLINIRNQASTIHRTWQEEGLFTLMMSIKYLADIYIGKLQQEHPDLHQSLTTSNKDIDWYDNPFPVLAQKLIKRFYHNPEAWYEFDRSSTSHGPMHVCRVALYIPLLIQFYKEVHVKETYNLSQENIFYLQIAAIMHDSARRGNACDYWDEESAFKCKMVLLELGCDEKTASLYSDAIRYKDKPFNEKNILQKLLHDADCLDVIRVRSLFPGHRFDIKYLDIYNYIKNNAKAMDLLIDFVLAIREFITMQYDLKDASAIDLNGKQVGNIIWGNRNTAVKAQYDNADNCYLKIETLLKTSEASDGSFSLMTLLDKVELPKLTKVRKQVEQFSDAHDIDYLVRTFNDKLFHPNKNIAIEEIKLSLSGNLHFILNSDIEDNNEKAFAQNYLWLTNKIHCVDERAQEYSLLYSNVPEFLRLLSVDYKRFITLINDRLYKLLNKGGCIFINDNQKVYVYGNDFKKGIELTDTQLTDKLLAQKRGYAYTFWGIEEIYPENIYWLIKNVCADKTQSDDVGSYVKR